MVGKLVALVAGGLILVGSAHADVDPLALCSEKKSKAAGKKAFDLLKAFGKNEKRPNPVKLDADISKAESKFTKGFTRAEAKGQCLTSGDSDAIEVKVGAFVADVIQGISDITSTTTTTTTLPPSGMDRLADPVVLAGAMVPWLSGIGPQDMVAFRHDPAGWTQIPVQVDERDIINFDDVYNHVGGHGGGITVLDYTDTGTFTGPDADPTIDADDEIVLMARDTGDEASTSSEPSGVVSGSGVEIVVTDPVGGGIGYVYLFEHDGSLNPGAGQQYVNYQFNLLSGDYKTTYRIDHGPNPEDSTVTTAHYARHFSDRWIQDELRILTAPSTGIDILDRHKFLFAPGICNRSEDTFSNGEGAFIINKSGPVRGIRSYVGANSGPLSQRQHLYYDRREDITTFLRVHSISGGMDFLDYSPAAAGMTYQNNNNNLAPVTIDGVPDSLAAGSIAWELVAGPQGSLVMVGVVDTDIPGLSPTSYYLDDETPSVTQCTGDAFAYGSSGGWIDQGIPNTDPRNPPANVLTATRVIYYGPPGRTVADAEQRNAWVTNPLATTVNLWP